MRVSTAHYLLYIYLKNKKVIVSTPDAGMFISFNIKEEYQWAVSTAAIWKMK